MNHERFYNHAPQLKRIGLKKTDQKQWDKFIVFMNGILFNSYLKNFKHNCGEGLVIHDAYIKSKLGSNPKFYDRDIEMSCWFTTDGKYKYVPEGFIGAGNRAKCWIPTALFYEQRDAILKDPALKSAYWKRLARAAVEAFGDQAKEETIAAPCFFIENLDEKMQDIFESGTEVDMQDFVMLQSQREANENLEDLLYRVSECSRRTTLLQGLSRINKIKIFHLFWDCDLKACAPNVLLQKAAQLTDIDFPLIRAYTNDPSFLRTIVAKTLKDCGFKSSDAEIEELMKVAKSLLQGLFFGMLVPSFGQLIWDFNTAKQKKDLNGLPKGQKQFMFSILKTVRELDIAIALVSCPEYARLVRETKVLFDVISTAIKPKVRVDGMWELTNAAGAVKKFKRWNKRKAVAHEYFGLESRMLDIMIAHVDEPTLMMHDGFICKNKPNIVAIELVIKTQLNLTMTVVAKQLKAA